jgi:hypothetical protein
VLGAGVVIRLATDEEAAVVERARRGRDFSPEPKRNYMLVVPERPLGKNEAYVVRQAFIEFVDGRDTYRRFGIRLLAAFAVGTSAPLHLPSKRHSLACVPWPFDSTSPPAVLVWTGRCPAQSAIISPWPRTPR